MLALGFTLVLDWSMLSADELRTIAGNMICSAVIAGCGWRSSCRCSRLVYSGVSLRRMLAWTPQAVAAIAENKGRVQTSKIFAMHGPSE